MIQYLRGQALNGILPDDGKLDRDTLPGVQMPNRDGFIPEPEFTHFTNSR
jgi:cytochrome c